MKKTITISSLVFTILCGCNFQDNSNANSIIAIKKTILEKSNHLIEAATRLDMDSILSFYDKNVSAIEQGHMHLSSEEFISTYTSAIESVAEVHKIDIINPRIQVLCKQVVLYEAKLIQNITLKDGNRIEAINVLTLVYTLINEDWKIIHHHGSFPVE